MDGLGLCGRSPQRPKPKKIKMAIFEVAIFISSYLNIVLYFIIKSSVIQDWMPDSRQEVHGVFL
jgi:hypothetical protein